MILIHRNFLFKVLYSLIKKLMKWLIKIIIYINNKLIYKVKIILRVLFKKIKVYYRN